jgi:hypothetical protein
MQLFKKMLQVLAVGGATLFCPLAANAAIYTPASNALTGIVVAPNTFVQSWFVNGADAPANQNIATVEAFLETLAPALFGDIAQVGGANYDTAGFTSTGANAGTSSFAGNLFAVHTGAGEFIYAFNSIISGFSISIPAGSISDLTNGMIQCGGGIGTGCGTGLSNIRVFNSPNLNGGGNPDPVPLPGALVFMVSALGGMGALRRFSKA